MNKPATTETGVEEESQKMRNTLHGVRMILNSQLKM